jgi:hypothetical protein
MKNKFASSLHALKKIATRFDKEASHLKTGLLNTLSKSALTPGETAPALP